MQFIEAKDRNLWENAILNGFSLFRSLTENNGGKIYFDMQNQSAIYQSV